MLAPPAAASLGRKKLSFSVQGVCMSPLIRNNIDPSNPLYYAPPRMRQPPLEPRLERPDDEGQALVPSSAGSAPARQGGSPEDDPRRQARVFEEAISRAIQEQLEPDQIPSPYAVNRRAGRLWGVVAKFALAAAAAAAIALVLVTVVPMTRSPTRPGDDGPSLASRWQSLKASLFPAPLRKQASTLVVNDSSGGINETLQLGISVSAPSPGATVTLRGLPPGARLTAGKRIGVGEWRVPAQEIAAAAVIPPDDFSGQVTVAAELRGDDGEALVGSSVHLAWVPASLTTASTTTMPQQTPAAAAVPPQVMALAPSSTPPNTPTTATPMVAAPTAPPPRGGAPPLPVVRNLDPREIASFLSRAQELITAGDLQSARLLLRRAAEAQNARAAFALAQTYDPAVLKQYGASAPPAEVATARSWYERARDWGSPDAQRQLDALEALAR
jgi:hypothetical protein